MTEQESLERAKKLKALAEHGIGGERDNAREQLDRLMERCDIQENDLDDEPLEIHFFCYHNSWEKRLLRQIMSKVAPDRRQYIKRCGKGARTSLGCKCTEAEAIRIQAEFEFFAPVWAEEVELFFAAFVQKHELFDTSPGHDTREVDPETLRRMLTFMGAIQDRQPTPMLGYKETDS